MILMSQLKENVCDVSTVCFSYGQNLGTGHGRVLVRVAIHLLWQLHVEADDFLNSLRLRRHIRHHNHDEGVSGFLDHFHPVQ